MAKHTDTRPAHHRIAAQIRAEIMSGDLAASQQLPITQDLVTQYGVSSQTIQRALGLLKAEGYIVGRSGRGVFVRDSPQQAFDSVATMPPARDGEPYVWIKEAAKQSKTGTNKILRVAEVVPPTQVRDALGLEPGGTVAMRERLLLLDGDPAELVCSYYPMDIAQGTALLERKKIKGGSPTLLADKGYPPREMVDRVSCRPPTEEEFIGLELPTEVPVLRTFRVVYSDNAKPIEVTVMVKAAHLHELLYRVPLDLD
ncbi:GntR family transcriptional regulator [Streptomyces sp. NPDC056462]|uniref:GntR family transcriptional regulator n=1 Tax=Streptomyces sp. NPDC056462 TaxID=3345826 RepID=UPI0036A1AE35